MWDRFLARLGAVGGAIKDCTVNEGSGPHSAGIHNLWENLGAVLTVEEFSGDWLVHRTTCTSTLQHTLPFSTVSLSQPDDNLAETKSPFISHFCFLVAFKDKIGTF